MTIKFGLIVRKNGKYAQQKLWTPEEFKKELTKQVQFVLKFKVNRIKFFFSREYRDVIAEKTAMSILAQYIKHVDKKVDEIVKTYKKPVKGSKR